MKKLLLALVLLSLPLAGLAQAKSFKLGTPPIASVTMPDKWKPEETDAGVEATSPDEEIYLAVEVASVAKLDDAITQALGFLMGEGVVPDTSTQKEENFEVNGMKAFALSYLGKDKDGPTKISLVIIIPNQTTALILTYWGTEKGEQTHGKTLTGILQSIKKS